MPKIMVFVTTAPWPPHIYPEALKSIFELKWPGPYEIIFGRDDFTNKLPPRDKKIRSIAEKYIRARQIFLAGNYDAMLTIESDHIIPPDALLKMNQVDADIVYGLYCSRPDKRHLWTLRQGVETGLQSYSPEFMQSVWNRVVPSYGIGTGCTLIRRNVLEAIPFHGEKMYHDWNLAKEAKAAGFRQMHDCRVIVGHILSPGHVVWPDPKKTYKILTINKRVRA
jgi:hypothetical protein